MSRLTVHAQSVYLYMCSESTLVIFSIKCEIWLSEGCILAVHACTFDNCKRCDLNAMNDHA